MNIQYKLDKITGKTLPTERLLFKFGKNKTTKGTFILTKESAEKIIQSWKEYGNKLNFDYNHQQLAEIQTAESGASAGTYDLEIREQGLYAINIVWTDKAAQMIANKEYLYTSPAFWTEKQGDTEVIIELINCALTNIPATIAMDELMAASRFNIKEIIMTEELIENVEVLAVEAADPIPAEPTDDLGDLPEITPEDEIEALKNMLAEKESKIAELEAKLAELQGESELNKSELSKKDSEIVQLSGKIELIEKKEIVKLAINDGKLHPAQTELYLGLDKAKLITEVSKLPKSPVLNRTIEIDQSTTELTEVQKLTAYINKRVFGK